MINYYKITTSDQVSKCKVIQRNLRYSNVGISFKH
jgi:hypothetical protein